MSGPIYTGRVNSYPLASAPDTFFQTTFDGYKAMIKVHGVHVIMTRIPLDEVRNFERCLHESLNREPVSRFLKGLPPNLKPLDTGGYIPPLVTHATTMRGVTDDIVDKLLIPLLKNALLGIMGKNGENAAQSPPPQPPLPPPVLVGPDGGPCPSYDPNKYHNSPGHWHWPALVEAQGGHFPTLGELDAWHREAQARDAFDEMIRQSGRDPSEESARLALAWGTDWQNAFKRGAWPRWDQDAYLTMDGNYPPLMHHIVLAMVQAGHIAEVYKKYAFTSQEGIAWEVRFLGAEWRRIGDYYILLDGDGRPVTDMKGFPLIVPFAAADYAAGFLEARPAIGESQAAALTAAGLGAAVKGELPKTGLDKAALIIGLMTALPNFTYDLPEAIRGQLILAISAASTGNRLASFDPENLIPGEKHLDALARQLVVSNLAYQNALDDLLGENSRRAMYRRHMQAQAGMNKIEIFEYNKEVRGNIELWKNYKRIYREALERYWTPDWTLEHAEKMAERFDRNQALLDMYEKGLPEEVRNLPEGHGVLDDFNKRAKRLGLGSGIPMAESLAGLAAALAVGKLAGALTPATATGAAVISGMELLGGILGSTEAGRWLKDKDVDERTREVKANFFPDEEQ